MPENLSSYFDSIGAQATAFVVALTGGVFGLQKAMRMWHSNANDINYTKAEGDILNGLREELTRMHDQNAKLATAVNTLQTTMIELNAKLSTFEQENAQMKIRLTQQCDMCESRAVSGLAAQL